MNTRNCFSDTGIRLRTTSFSNVTLNTTKALSTPKRATSLLPPILGRSRSVSSNNFKQFPSGQQTLARRPVPVSPPKQAPTLRNMICMTLSAVDVGHGLTFNQLSEYISKVFEVARTVASDLRLKKTLCNMVARGWLAQCTGLGPYDSTYKLASPPTQNTSGLMIHGRPVPQADHKPRGQLPRGPHGATTQARPAAAAQSHGPQKTVRLSGPTRGPNRRPEPCAYPPPPPVRSNSPSIGIDQEELPQEIMNLQDDFAQDVNAGGDFERKREAGQNPKDPYGLQSSSYKPTPSVLKTDDNPHASMTSKPGLQQRISIFAVDDPTFSLGISEVQMPTSLVSPCPSAGRGSSRRTGIRMQ